MKRLLLIPLLTFLAWILGSHEPVSATVLSIELDPFVTKCLFTQIGAVGEKFVFFYSILSDNKRVISTVKDPSGRVIFERTDSSTVDVVLPARVSGEHSFCFSNPLNSLSKERLNVEIVTENESRFSLSGAVQAESPEGRTLRTINEYFTRMSHIFINIEHLQRFSRSIEYRDENLVKKVGKYMKIIMFSQFWLLVIISALQIACVRLLFSTKKKNGLI